MLDVSFAHTGGILAVVTAPEDLWRPEAENGACVLKAYDNLRIEPDEKELGMLSSKDKEIVKSSVRYLICSSPEKPFLILTEAAQ